MAELSSQERAAREKVCLPLDGLASLEAVEALVEELSPFVGLFKVGKESFTRFGPSVVSLVQERGAGVFLDLKFHDIPNTVRGAARAAAELGVSMFNVHAAGGPAMMAAARDGVEEAAPAPDQRPRILAVTVLTSIDQEILNRECGVPGSVEDQVLRLARMTEASGLDGIVCSAADMHALRGKLRPGFMFVTPGIKGTTTPAGEDQKRVLSPGRAVAAGSSPPGGGQGHYGSSGPQGRGPGSPSGHRASTAEREDLYVQPPGKRDPRSLRLSLRRDHHQQRRGPVDVRARAPVRVLPGEEHHHPTQGREPGRHSLAAHARTRCGTPWDTPTRASRPPSRDSGS